MDYSTKYDNVFVNLILKQPDMVLEKAGNILLFNKTKTDFKTYCVCMSYLNWGFAGVDSTTIGCELIDNTIFCGVYDVREKIFITRYPMISSDSDAKYICNQEAIEEFKKKLNI